MLPFLIIYIFTSVVYIYLVAYKLPLSNIYIFSVVYVFTR